MTEHYSQLREVFARGGNTVSFGIDRARAFFRHMRGAGKLLAISVSLPDGTSIATGLFTIDERGSCCGRGPTARRSVGSGPPSFSRGPS